MVKGKWIKHFTDGSTEEGSDHNIAFGNASWTRGRLEDISKVELTNGAYNAILEVPKTEWLQFDRLQAMATIGKNILPTRQYRVIQALIKPEHVGSYLLVGQSRIGKTFFWKLAKTLDSSITNDSYRNIIKDAIGPADVDKWFSVVVYSDHPPIYLLSERGTVR